MNYFQTLLLSCTFLVLLIPSAQSQNNSSPTFVIVHGVWGGGWAFKEVDSILTSQGAKVYRPTLTGQGEKVHLATKDVGLDTHILDIVNVILFEELTNIILVGHSYGGMVITGVADRVPERIQKIIYTDAFVPDNGESVNSIRGSQPNQKRLTTGYIPASWVSNDAPYPKDVPHPYKTWTDTISLNNKLRLEIPTTYILTVNKGTQVEKDGFYDQMIKTKKKGWPTLELEADHNMQWSAPNEFSRMILNISKE